MSTNLEPSTEVIAEQSSFVCKKLYFKMTSGEKLCSQKSPVSCAIFFCSFNDKIIVVTATKRTL